MWNSVKIVKFGQNCEILSKLWNSVKIVKSCQNCEILSKLWNFVKIVKFCQNCEILSKLWNSVKIGKFVENMMSEHCVRHCMLMMVCSIVLGKAKTTKGCYELQIVNQLMNEWMNDKGRYRAARAAKNCGNLVYVSKYFHFLCGNRENSAAMRVSSHVHHCVLHCRLNMVCGIVLGKAKTTKVGMVWYEFNIVN